MQRRHFLKSLGAGIAALSPLRLLAGSSPNPVLRVCKWNVSSEYIAVPDGPAVYNPSIDCESRPIISRNPDFVLIRNMAAAVNSRTIRLINDITQEVEYCSPETVLFIGSKISREANGEFSQVFKVAVKQCVAADQLAPGGWNHFFDPATQTWRRLKNFSRKPDLRHVGNPDNSDVYKLADISRLWT